MSSPFFVVVYTSLFFLIVIYLFVCSFIAIYTDSFRQTLIEEGYPSSKDRWKLKDYIKWFTGWVPRKILPMKFKNYVDGKEFRGDLSDGQVEDDDGDDTQD